MSADAMQHVMLDLETMGTGPDAAITAIGAVSFELESGELGFMLYVPVRLDSSVSLGGTMDASTVLWWNRQADAAREHLWDPNARSLPDALDAFTSWCLALGAREQIAVWGNGSDFDNAILRSAYQRCNMPAPWTHRGNRCYRTAKQLLPGPELQRIGTHHNALNDAVSQARHLVGLWQLHQTVKAAS